MKRDRTSGLPTFKAHWRRMPGIVLFYAVGGLVIASDFVVLEIVLEHRDPHARNGAPISQTVDP